MKNIIAILCSLAFITILMESCSQLTQNPEKTLLIKGRITNAKAGDIMKLQELGIKKIYDIDSTKIRKDGQFKFSTYPEYPNLYVLKLNKKHVTLVGNAGDTLKFKAARESFMRNYSVAGNKSAEILESYFHFTNQQRMKLDSLGKVFRNSKHRENFYEIRNEIDSAYKAIVRNQKAFAENIIRAKPGRLAALYILNQRLFSFKLFSETQDYELFKLIDSALQNTQPESKHTKDHHQRVAKRAKQQKQQRLAEERLKKGAIAPVFALTNPRGDTIKPSDYRDHYLILGFWASWNALSRQNNHTLVELYKKYENDGLRILGVSFDEKRKMWEGAIEVDKLAFDHISDLKQLNSPVARLYNINKIPRYFLLDKKGRIMAKDMKMEELKSKIDSLYNDK